MRQMDECRNGMPALLPCSLSDLLSRVTSCFLLHPLCHHIPTFRSLPGIWFHQRINQRHFHDIVLLLQPELLCALNDAPVDGEVLPTFAFLSIREEAWIQVKVRVKVKG